MTGILCLDKPEGVTSFAAVAKVRRLTGEKKAGHAGTLDPIASGVLPVFLGQATRFLDYFPNHDKAYRTVIKLGVTTDTQDITGKVLSETRTNITQSDVLAALPAFRGKINQIPPMYSALKKDGVPLYKLARQGIEIERTSRTVFIHRLELISFDEKSQEIILDVFCSKGTYIRSLASDLGNILGGGGVMKALRRTMALGFPIEMCYTFEKLWNLGDNISPCILPVDTVLPYPSIFISAGQTVRFSNGGALSLDRLALPCTSGLLKVYSPDKRFWGLGEIDAENQTLNIKRVCNPDVR